MPCHVLLLRFRALERVGKDTRPLPFLTCTSKFRIPEFDVALALMLGG